MFLSSVLSSARNAPVVRRHRFLAFVFGLAAANAVVAAGNWQTLFDGRDLSAWRTYLRPVNEPVKWKAEDGVLVCQKGSGSLITRETFRDFELELEWKISPGGNSGVMFGVDEKSSLPWHSGPEIQILDDSRLKENSGLHATGALYALYPPKKSAAKPVGEWNAMRIRVEKDHVQAWLNGQVVVDAQIGTEDWKARVAKSKFAPFPQFAKVKDGHILLQDHNEPVWFRNIRIRRL